MGTVRIQREGDGGTVTLSLEGTFDGQAAQALRQLLDEVQSDDVVVVFSRVKEFFDLALAALSTTVRERKVTMRGLRTHQERMFRYLGVESTVIPDGRAYYTPEDVLSA
jgi:hypothetical protein